MIKAFTWLTQFKLYKKHIASTEALQTKMNPIMPERPIGQPNFQGSEKGLLHQDTKTAMEPDQCRRN
jgi:hypothetical protein